MASGPGEMTILSGTYLDDTRAAVEICLFTSAREFRSRLGFLLSLLTGDKNATNRFSRLFSSFSFSILPWSHATDDELVGVDSNPTLIFDQSIPRCVAVTHKSPRMFLFFNFLRLSLLAHRQSRRFSIRGCAGFRQARRTTHTPRDIGHISSVDMREQ